MEGPFYRRGGGSSQVAALPPLDKTAETLDTSSQVGGRSSRLDTSSQIGGQTPRLDTTWQQGRRRQQSQDRSEEYLQAFKNACSNKYRNLSRAWQLLLDPDRVGRISFVPFHKAARIMGFFEVQQLWSALDSDRSGFITLDEWCSRTYQHLVEFRTICHREYGGVEHAFNHGMDRTGSRTVTYEELSRFCDDMDYSGSVRVLFNALDLKMDGYLTLDEMPFVDACVGERCMKPKGGLLPNPSVSPRLGSTGRPCLSERSGYSSRHSPANGAPRGQAPQSARMRGSKRRWRPKDPKTLKVDVKLPVMTSDWSKTLEFPISQQESVGETVA